MLGGGAQGRLGAAELAQSLLSRIGASPLGRAGLATVFILALAGLVQFGLPMACDAGAAFCKGEATLAELEPVDSAVAEESLVAEASEPSASASVDVTAAEPVTAVAALEQAVLPGTNDLIAQTFSLLEVELTTTQPAELSKRTVRTVAINADGTPVTTGESLEPPAPLVAEASVEPVSASEEPVSSEEPVVSSEAPVEVAAAEPVAEPEEERTSSLAYAPASGDVATVRGKGANVRSVPAVGGSEVLFALPGQEEVTIVQMSKGWAKIVDSSGRSGWIYGQYLSRG